MAGKRYLIVNADDFGQSPGVNRGVMNAQEEGIVTSASLMVRWPAAAEAAGYTREQPRLSLGLHFDLEEWAYRWALRNRHGHHSFLHRKVVRERGVHVGVHRTGEQPRHTGLMALVGRSAGLYRQRMDIAQDEPLQAAGGQLRR